MLEESRISNMSPSLQAGRQVAMALSAIRTYFVSFNRLTDTDPYNEPITTINPLAKGWSQCDSRAASKHSVD